MRSNRAKLKVIFAIAAVVLCALGVFASLWLQSAAAQVTQPPAAVTTPCAPSTSTGPGLAKPPASTGAAPSQNLSDTLARSDGVICPPANVDPEIKAPTPDAGNMPIIPPPGSPGGDPNVRPK